MSSKGRVIVIDNDEHVCKAAGQALMLAGYSVDCCSGAKQSINKISRQWPGVLVTDVKMPGMDGFELLHHVVRHDPDLPVILVTGHGDVSMAVEAMRQGAYDFIEKPLSSTHLIDVVGRAMEKRRLILDNRTLRAEVRRKNGLESVIVGRSKKIAKLREMILNVADTDADVLIIGETGTGKELVARCLHEQSRRQDSRFVAVNCGAIPEAIIENELFGHEPGAYTGADRLHIGKFELADGGTLFLDEIAEMSPVLQVKILRVLQERQFERVGGTKTIKSDFRVIAATNRNLADEVKNGRFREDLYYRLTVLPVSAPSLRERFNDISLLADYFVKKFNQSKERSIRGIDPEVISAFLNYSWPGNVRELENVIERMVILAEGEMLTVADLPERFVNGASLPGAGDIQEIPDQGFYLSEMVGNFEKKIIIQAMKQTGWVKNQAAKLINVNRTTLLEKMKRFGIKKEDYDK
jgi:DNA-binding NtrC family response regulator